MGGASQLRPLKILLPVGISFFTFQSMSYTIDVYRRRLKPTSNFLHFMAYLALFPQLVAGPIVRACDLLPALELWHPPSAAVRWANLRLIAIGFFKKMVIADNLAPLVDQAFESPVLQGAWAYWWVVSIMFAAQIYCDFSGYTDIARGLGGLMGYEFPENFNHPYAAIGFRDFWSRWHISLSTWFRDYVYVPLGGSRHGAVRGYVNMWITMLLSGIWHGAGWTFIVWGGASCSLLDVGTSHLMAQNANADHWWPRDWYRDHFSFDYDRVGTVSICRHAASDRGPVRNVHRHSRGLYRPSRSHGG